MIEKTDEYFPFEPDDVILAKYEKEVYYAKILSINRTKKTALLLFDDNSREEVNFKNIFNVNETTSDIVCVMCKEDRSETDDDIVLCDRCTVGYHQLCHKPAIPSNVLAPEIPWECRYCTKGGLNPYIETNPFKENSKMKDVTTANENIEQVKTDIIARYSIDETCEDMKEKSNALSYGFILSEKEKNKMVDKNENNNQSEQEQTSNIPSDILKEKDLTESEKSLQTSQGDCLNHVETSAFQVISKSKENNIPNELRRKEPREQPSKAKITVPPCSHHDITGVILHESYDGPYHCNHSDVYVNYSPEPKSPYNELVINLKDKIDEDNSNTNSKSNDTSQQVLLASESIQEKVALSAYACEENGTAQQRYAMDLPQHNWLLEQLKSEKKLAEAEIEKLQTKRRMDSNVTEAQLLKAKEEQEREMKDNPKESDIQIVKVESLSKTKTTSADNVLLCLAKNTSTNPNAFVQTTGIMMSTNTSYNWKRNLPGLTRFPHTTALNDYVSSSFASNCYPRSIYQNPPVKSSRATILNAQPKIITDSPSKQHSIPSSKDLASVQYSSLSSFKSNAQNNVSNSEQMYNDLRNVEPRFNQQLAKNRDPFDSKYIHSTSPNIMNNKSYSFEQERYNESHRSRVSLTPLSPLSKRNENVAQNMYGQYNNISLQSESTSTSSQLSPESLKRRIEIHCQLENQKQWIDEHDTKLQLQVSRKGRYLQSIGLRQERSMSEQYTNQIKSPYCVSPRDVGITDEIICNDQRRSPALLQKQDYLEQRIAMYTNEIDTLKKQKKLLSSSPEKLAIDDKLRSLEAYRTRQSQELMNYDANESNLHQKSNAEVFHAVHKNNSPVSAESYIHKLYSNREARLTQKELKVLRKAEIQQQLVKTSHQIPSRRVNAFENISSNENSFMRQLQNKHDEFQMVKQPQLMRNMIIAEQLQLINKMKVNQEQIRKDKEDQKKIEELMSRRNVASRFVNRQERLFPQNVGDRRYQQNSPQENSLKRRSSESYLGQNKIYRKSPPMQNTPLIPAQMHNFSSATSPYSQEKYPVRDSHFGLPSVKNNSPLSRERDLDPSPISTQPELNQNLNKKPSVKRLCKLCYKDAQFLCSGCRRIWYCSQKCQLSDWKTHSRTCKKTDTR